MSQVTFVRVEHLPDDMAATYECFEDGVTIKIRDDLITAEGGRVLAELASAFLSEYWQPRTRLRLVT